ncbi:MAG: hypothetical protein WC662_04285, partial [Candidatus Paceibacterota bacterium]
IPKHLAFIGTKYSGFDTFVNWNEERKEFFINSFHPNLSEIVKKLNEADPGCAVDVRGTMIFGKIKNLTEEQFLNIIDPKILEPKKIDYGTPTGEFLTPEEMLEMGTDAIPELNYEDGQSKTENKTEKIKNKIESLETRKVGLENTISVFMKEMPNQNFAELDNFVKFYEKKLSETKIKILIEYFEDKIKKINLIKESLAQKEVLEKRLNNLKAIPEEKIETENQEPEKEEPKNTEEQKENVIDKKLSYKTYVRKEGIIETGKLEIANLPKEIIHEFKGEEHEVYMNNPELQGILLARDGNYLFKAMQGRLFTLAKVGDFYLPFYISSNGTSGKKAGEWYPFFGYTGDWLVKGNVTPDGKMEYSNKISAVQNLLNKNFKIPNNFFNQEGKMATTDGKPLFDLNSVAKYQSWFVETKSSEFDKRRKDELTWVGEKTGLYPTKVTNTSEPSDDSAWQWRHNIISLIETGKTYENKPEEPNEKVKTETPEKPKEQFEYETKNYSIKEIENTLKEYLLSMDGIKTVNIKLTGVGEKINLKGEIDGKAKIEIKGTMQNKNGIIDFEKEPKIKMGFAARTLAGIMGINIKQEIQKVPEHIKKFIEKKENQIVEKMEIKNGQLEVTFKKKVGEAIKEKEKTRENQLEKITLKDVPVYMAGDSGGFHVFEQETDEEVKKVLYFNIKDNRDLFDKEDSTTSLAEIIKKDEIAEKSREHLKKRGWSEDRMKDVGPKEEERKDLHDVVHLYLKATGPRDRSTTTIGIKIPKGIDPSPFMKKLAEEVYEEGNKIGALYFTYSDVDKLGWNEFHKRQSALKTFAQEQFIKYANEQIENKKETSKPEIKKQNPEELFEDKKEKSETENKEISIHRTTQTEYNKLAKEFNVQTVKDVGRVFVLGEEEAQEVFDAFHDTYKAIEQKNEISLEEIKKKINELYGLDFHDREAMDAGYPPKQIIVRMIEENFDRTINDLEENSKTPDKKQEERIKIRIKRIKALVDFLKELKVKPSFIGPKETTKAKNEKDIEKLKEIAGNYPYLISKAEEGEIQFLLTENSIYFRNKYSSDVEMWDGEKSYGFSPEDDVKLLKQLDEKYETETWETWNKKVADLITKVESKE